MSTTTRITAIVGLALIVVALLFGIVGVATNSWVEARGEARTESIPFNADFRYGLWQGCLKLSISQSDDCAFLVLTCETSKLGPSWFPCTVFGLREVFPSCRVSGS